MRARSPANRLLVEGEAEKRLIPYLIERCGMAWGETEAQWLAKIESCDGIEKLLERRLIETYLDASGLERLAIVVDADHDAAAVYERVRLRCEARFPSLPPTLPAEGVCCVHGGKRLGIWVMPDNRNHGMLETFMVSLIGDQALLGHAITACREAEQQGAPFRSVHRDKAHVHTWLAWQDPPGRQLHNAVTEKMFATDAPLARTFAEWFAKVFEVQPVRAPGAMTPGDGASA